MVSISSDFIQKLATDSEFKKVRGLCESAVKKVFAGNKKVIMKEEGKEPDIKKECQVLKDILEKHGLNLEAMSNTDIYKKIIYPVIRFKIERCL